MTKKTLKKVAVGYVMYEAIMWIGICIYLKKHKIKEIEGVGIYKIPSSILNNVFRSRYACTTQLFTKPVIFIDNEFYEVCNNDECIADFIIAHELAHIKLGHIKENIKILLSGKVPKRNIAYEIEADTYACTKYPSVSVNDVKRFFDSAICFIEPERIDNINAMKEGEL